MYDTGDAGAENKGNTGVNEVPKATGSDAGDAGAENKENMGVDEVPKATGSGVGVTGSDNEVTGSTPVPVPVVSVAGSSVFTGWEPDAFLLKNFPELVAKYTTPDSVAQPNLPENSSSSK